jgi:hypothetical protein
MSSKKGVTLGEVVLESDNGYRLEACVCVSHKQGHNFRKV